MFICNVNVVLVTQGIKRVNNDNQIHQRLQLPHDS